MKLWKSSAIFNGRTMAMAAMNMVSAGGFSGVSFHLRRCQQGVASVLCMKTPIFESQRSKLDNLTVYLMASMSPHHSSPTIFPVSTSVVYGPLCHRQQAIDRELVSFDRSISRSSSRHRLVEQGSPPRSIDNIGSRPRRATNNACIRIHDAAWSTFTLDTYTAMYGDDAHLACARAASYERKKLYGGVLIKAKAIRHCGWTAYFCWDSSYSDTLEADGSYCSRVS